MWGSIRDRLWKVSDISITFILYYMMGIALHEYWHVNIARMRGYTVSSAYFNWFSGYALLKPYPANMLDIVLVGLFGGLGVALFYGLISLFTNDWETRLIQTLFIPWQIFYAIFEVFYLLDYISINDLVAIPLVLGITIATIIFFWRRIRKR